MENAYEFLSKGGWIMVPIGIASIIALALFLERIWSLQRNKALPSRFLEVVDKLLRDGRYTEAEALCHQNDSHIARVLEEGIRYAGLDQAVIRERMEAAGQREVFFMERFTGALGSIATVAPLLGLLGTVTGMISVFQRVVSQSGSGQAVDPGALANGIWEALITTATGLTVAIPTYLAYRFVLSIVDRYAVEMADVALKASEYLVPEAQRPTSNRNGENKTVDTREAEAKTSQNKEKTAETDV